MTQPNVEASAKGLALLQDVLQLLAQSMDLSVVTTPILEAACRLTGAKAGFYLVFDMPHFVEVFQLAEDLLPDDSHLLEIATRLLQEARQDIHLSPDVPQPLATHYSGWLVTALAGTTVDESQDDVNEPVALLGLLLADELAVDEQNLNLMVSLIDGLKAVTHSERIIARHKMLARNQSEFVRITTHDLRSPLTAMRGFASMLESDKFGDLNERQAHFIEKILSGVDQMSGLVDNIQDAGRFDPETGFYEMERTPTDLIDLVNQIVDSHLLPAEKQELTLRVSSSDDVPIVNVDRTMIERATTNLVDNAIKYTPNGGKIEVSVRRQRAAHGDHIVISVRDNGYGISEDNLKKLFQKHFRIHRREHSRVKGTGLGLFIVRSVAIRHNGNAWVESVEGEGSTFSIRIPLKGKNLLFGTDDD